MRGIVRLLCLGNIVLRGVKPCTFAEIWDSRFISFEYRFCSAPLALRAASLPWAELPQHLRAVVACPSLNKHYETKKYNGCGKRLPNGLQRIFIIFL